MTRPGMAFVACPWSLPRCFPVKRRPGAEVCGIETSVPGFRGVGLVGGEAEDGARAGACGCGDDNLIVVGGLGLEGGQRLALRLR